MHFALSVSMSPNSEVRTRIEEHLLSILKSYEYVRVFSDFYIIKVESDAMREQIRVKIVEVAKQEGSSFHFVVSPNMTGDKYNGWLPSYMWEKINNVTK